MSINSVILTGRLTKDIELRTTPSGANVCSFSIAVDDYNGKENVAYFIECVAWNKQAEFLSSYCSKGTLIGIAGKITTRSYDRKDGTKAYVTEVVCNQVQSLSQKKTETQTEQSQTQENEGVLSYDDDFSDLPF